LFKAGFSLKELDDSLRGLSTEGKLQLLSSVMDLIYRNEKLKHTVPPLRL